MAAIAPFDSLNFLDSLSCSCHSSPLDPIDSSHTGTAQAGTTQIPKINGIDIFPRDIPHWPKKKTYTQTYGQGNRQNQPEGQALKLSAYHWQVSSAKFSWCGCHWQNLYAPDFPRLSLDTLCLPRTPSRFLPPPALLVIFPKPLSFTR